jgi:hypothetical protein
LVPDSARPVSGSGYRFGESRSAKLYPAIYNPEKGKGRMNITHNVKHCKIVSKIGRKQVITFFSYFFETL